MTIPSTLRFIFCSTKVKFFLNLFSLRHVWSKNLAKDCDIKCMRTNNGGEYMYEDFLTYCEKHGIEGK